MALRDIYLEDGTKIRMKDLRSGDRFYIDEDGKRRHFEAVEEPTQGETGVWGIVGYYLNEKDEQPTT